MAQFLYLYFQNSYISNFKNQKPEKMKNLLTVLAFAASMFFGMHTVSAQSLSEDSNRPEVIAKEETHKLTQELGLNGDQTRAVFRALVAKEVNSQKIAKGKDLSSAPVKADLSKVDSELQATMKTILTDAQYAQWLKDQ